MTDFKTLLAAAKLPERTVPICLRGDLVAEFDRLERDLEDVLRVPAKSAEDDAATRIAERMEELRAEMREHTYDFQLRAMTRPRWHAFASEHPPRQVEGSDEIDPRDQLRGVNVDTFMPALIRQSVVDPVLSDEEWTLLLEQSLTSRQFEELWQAAWKLNRGEVDVPFSPAAYRMTQGIEPE